MSYKIPIYRPSLDGNEKTYVDECLDSSWISSKGKFIQLFEDSFMNFTGVPHATSVSNGTVALHLALVALGIRQGDEVIVPSFTYIASVSAISHCGATPVFVDSMRGTWQMDPEDVRRRITQRTKAIMVVHLYGHPCDMDLLTAIAKENGLFIVEDCAEAFGSLYRGRHVGTFGDIATFSFYGNKTITTGEGGMVVARDRVLHDWIYHLKMHGVSREREYWHDALGFNYRMTNICAAIGLAQIEKAEEKIRKKRQIADWYADGLARSSVEGHQEAPEVFHSYWMYSVLVERASIREKLRDHLRVAGIETRPTFHPAHTMPMYSGSKQHLQVAEDIASRGINLPSWPGLTHDQVSEICSQIQEFLSR